MTLYQSTDDAQLHRGGKQHVRDEALRWIKGVVVLLGILGMFFFAAVRSIVDRPKTNELCMEQVARDSHIALETFFQNPVDQDALVQMITTCSQ